MYTDNISKRLINALAARYPALKSAGQELDHVYCSLKECFIRDGILFCAGNGGSAADSEHIAGELMKGFLLKRNLPKKIYYDIKKTTANCKIAEKLQMGLRCISLTSHLALNTAFINDVDPSMAYAQQLFVLGRPGDSMLGLSTSGNAVNVCNAFKVARAKHITTILFTGMNHGICEAFADLTVHAPAVKTFEIQEFHLPLYHCLCMMLEDAFYGKN